MTDLCKLAAKYGTDKLGFYTAIYDLLLGQFRQQIKTVLEIGIGTVPTMTHVPGYKPGASLRMWEEYFPNAEVFAIDVEPTVLFEEGRIRTRQFDQSKRGELIQAAQWAGSKLDLVVDDGSHVPEHQILSAITLLNFVRPGGFYLVEDAHNLEVVSEALADQKIEHTVVKHRHNEATTGRVILIRKPEEEK